MDTSRNSSGDGPGPPRRKLSNRSTGSKGSKGDKSTNSQGSKKKKHRDRSGSKKKAGGNRDRSGKTGKPPRKGKRPSPPQRQSDHQPPNRKKSPTRTLRRVRSMSPTPSSRAILDKPRGIERSWSMDRDSQKGNLKRGKRPSPPSRPPPAGPNNRGRSKSPGRSGPHVKKQVRMRSNDPTKRDPRRLNRSRSPNTRRRPIRSMSPTKSTRMVIDRPRGRSADPAARNRMSNGSKNRSRSRDGFEKRDSNNSNIRKNGYPSQQPKKKKGYPSQKPRDNGRRGRDFKMYRSLRQSFAKRGQEFTWWKLAQYAVPCCILIGATVGLVFAMGHGSIITDTIDRLIPTFDNSELEDPFSGSDAPHWPRGGNGLTITVINALSDEWQNTFALATEDWTNGEPDAIEIIEETAAYDRDCEAPDGKVVVCNGDYGDSKWRGVNEALLDYKGDMVSSSARMNEYYLLNMGLGAWQYTMCHELGHTLGLGHTDENFDNADLGNCMDYTNNLNVNKHPDNTNYELLFSLYGPVSRRRQRRLRREGIRPVESVQTKHVTHRVPGVTTDSGSAAAGDSPVVSVKHLRKRARDDSGDPATTGVLATTMTIPDHVRHKKKAAVEKLLSRIREDQENDGNTTITAPGQRHEDGWKVVHRQLHGEKHEADLGEGFKVRVELLLVH